MSDWQVFWVMFCVVWVLSAVAVHIHGSRRRAEQRLWEDTFAPRRSGPPRVVP